MRNNIKNIIEVPDKMNLLFVSLGVMFIILILISVYYALRNKNFTPKIIIQTSNNNKSSTDVSKLPTGTDSVKSVPANSSIGMKVEDTPTNTEAPVGFEKIGDGKAQVYHVGENIYTFDDSEAVCKAFGAELATYEQLLDAYKSGADWCSVGWTKGQLALYPTQYKTWLKMQDNEPERRNACGETPGIQGAYQDNKNLLFGVNCYGVKPAPRGHEKIRSKTMSDKERQLAQKIAEIRLKSDQITIAPRNEDKWSSC